MLHKLLTVPWVYVLMLFLYFSLWSYWNSCVWLVGIVIATRIEAFSIVKQVRHFSGTQITSCIWLKETSISVAYVRITVMDWPRFVKLVYATGSRVINCTNIVTCRFLKFICLYSHRTVNFGIFFGYMFSTKSSLVYQWSDGCFSCLLQTSLFKFVSGCADLLPPLLFVPYMKMLCSLASHPQAARHAFNLLKQNVGNSVNVSWDHFFQSLNRYLVCGVFMSVLWRYFSWSHSESEMSYECGSDSHWLWNCRCYLLWCQCTCMSIKRHIQMEVSVRILMYEHRVRKLQELSVVQTCINDPDVLLKTMHSIVSCVKMDIQTRQSLWTSIWGDWYNTQTPSLITSIQILFNLVLIVQ